MRWMLALSSLLLGGCMGFGGTPPATTVPPALGSMAHIMKCPKLETYSGSMQKQTAEELRLLSPASQVATMVVDYGKLRSSIRKDCGYDQPSPPPQ